MLHYRCEGGGGAGYDWVTERVGIARKKQAVFVRRYMNDDNELMMKYLELKKYNLKIRRKVR